MRTRVPVPRIRKADHVILAWEDEGRRQEKPRKFTGYPGRCSRKKQETLPQAKLPCGLHRHLCLYSHTYKNTNVSVNTHIVNHTHTHYTHMCTHTHMKRKEIRLRKVARDIQHQSLLPIETHTHTLFRGPL